MNVKQRENLILSLPLCFSFSIILSVCVVCIFTGNCDFSAEKKRGTELQNISLNNTELL